jgi:hypothetical protein
MFKAAEVPPLELRRTGDGPTLQLVPQTAEGGFDETDLLQAAEIFAWPNSADGVRVHPRLLDLIYQACRQFDAPYVYIVSGYRGARKSSRHAQGRAADLVLPGVTDNRLARFFSEQGFVGVGLYPASGFVHLDVRGRSYFWIDRSGPGQAQRLRAILANRVEPADRRARRKGIEPVQDLPRPGAEAAEVPREEVADGSEQAREAAEGTP